jgi:hypothetical protein
MTIRDSTGFTGGAVYVPVSGGTGYDCDAPGGRADALAAQWLLGEDAGAEGAERARLEDVQRLARKQPTLAGGAAGHRARRVQAVELKLGGDVDPGETHWSTFGRQSHIPSRCTPSSVVTPMTHLWV